MERRRGGEEERRRGLRDSRQDGRQDGRQDSRQRLRYIHSSSSTMCPARYTRELTMETSSRMMKKSWALSMSWSRTKILTWRERSEDIVKTDTNTQRY